jgi:hypothetical protein
MRKQNKDHVKSLKKLSLKSGDIVVCTLKGTPYPYDVENLRNQFEAMPFMKGVNLIIATEKVLIRKSRPKSGKHQVFLDNLEYLEYLAKHKGA